MFLEASQNIMAKSSASLVRTLTLLLVLGFHGICLAEQGFAEKYFGWSTEWEFKRTYLYSSLYTRHYDPEPEHVNDQNLIGFEGQTADNRVLGLAIFDNSFGQRSEYLYFGRIHKPFRSKRWYVKLTGGVLHGYKEPYEDKIPFNDLGVAPAIIPGLGYRYKSFFAEFSQLGLAAGMVTAGFIF